MSNIPPPPSNHACHINGCPLPGTMSSGSGLERAYCHFHFQAEPKKIPGITAVIMRELNLIQSAQRLSRMRVGAPIDEVIKGHISVTLKRPDLLQGITTAYELSRRIYKDISIQMNISEVATRKETIAKSQQSDQWKAVAAAVKAKAAAFDDFSMGFEGE